jgi:hypothetical protein
VKALALILCASPALAGDSVTPGPVDLLIPFVIEVSDIGPYVPGMALSLVGGGWSDDALRSYVFGGQTIPPVPLPATLPMLAGAIGILAIIRRRA